MSALVSIEAGLDNSCCTSQNKTSGALQRRCEYFFADVGSRSQFAADRLGGAIGNGPDLAQAPAKPKLMAQHRHTVGIHTTGRHVDVLSRCQSIVMCAHRNPH